VDDRRSNLLPGAARVIDWPRFMRDDYAQACRSIARRIPAGLRSSYDAADFVSRAIIELLEDDRASRALVVHATRQRLLDVFRVRRNRVATLTIDPPSREPSPVLELDAAELRARLIARRFDYDEQMLIAWRLDGFTAPEIAARSGLSLRKVQRFFRQFGREERVGHLRTVQPPAAPRTRWGVERPGYRRRAHRAVRGRPRSGGLGPGIEPTEVGADRPGVPGDAAV
jgi:DNA-directed RNA polymerase specialized sigma24 family protein